MRLLIEKIKAAVADLVFVEFASFFERGGVVFFVEVAEVEMFVSYQLFVFGFGEFWFALKHGGVGDV